jgi:aldose 1-epimerase
MSMTNIETHRLRNSRGTEVHFVNLGATVTKILFDGVNVAVGPENVSHNPSYAGVIVGRVANRIRGGKFSLQGTEYKLFQNDGENSLHGGKKGFDKVFWKVEELSLEKKYRLSYQSSDLEEGYPGNLSVSVIYSLSDDDTFTISYEAQTDKVTHVNLTSHCYFNLAGKGTVLDHELTINADTFTEAGEGHLPTGKILPVEGATDFRKGKPIGKDISFSHDGYNHNFIVTENLAAVLSHRGSGRKMEVRTTAPGLMLYTGFYLDVPYAGVALEAQHYPDSPNIPSFPSTVLSPGEKYRQETSYRFSKTHSCLE